MLTQLQQGHPPFYTMTPPPPSHPPFAFLIPHPTVPPYTHTHIHTLLFVGDQKPSSEAPHLGMFAKEAGPGRAALHAPVDWLHQVWPAVLLAWPRAVGAVQLGKASCCHVGLQSPAVAQEVDDVWRGHRVPLSLSTPGNVQRPSQADRGQRAEEVGEPVGTCLENRPPSHSLASVLGDAEVAPQPRASLQVELAGTSRPLPSIPRTAPSLLSPDPSAVTVAQPGLLMSVLPHHRSLLSALAYRLEPVSARYQGPHTHTHRIPPLAARGEGEVNISPNGWDSLEVSPRESARTGLITEAAQEVPQKEKEVSTSYRKFVFCSFGSTKSGP
ncbi:hypothetical protein NQZ68_027561 [Dissostichus eleginoides]|nr:hypothetical protein NQZ68_027561 [Dissostichus eleginoides]